MVEVDPCGMVTLDGTFATEGEALIPIVAPPLNAADDKLTVQVEPAEGDKEVGLQERLLRTGVWRIVTVPPLAVVGIADPVESADTPLVSVTDDEVSDVELARFNVTEATTLLGSEVVFRPQTRQVALPDPLVQESVLVAASEPAENDAEVKSVVE